MKDLLKLLEDQMSGIYVEGYGDVVYTDSIEELAEALKPLLAEVWERGFSGGFELAADDIGAWDVLTDHGVTLSDYGLTNPYTEETE